MSLVKVGSHVLQRDYRAVASLVLFKAFRTGFEAAQVIPEYTSSFVSAYLPYYVEGGHTNYTQ